MIIGANSNLLLGGKRRITTTPQVAKRATMTVCSTATTTTTPDRVKSSKKKRGRNKKRSKIAKQRQTDARRARQEDTLKRIEPLLKQRKQLLGNNLATGGARSSILHLRAQLENVQGALKRIDPDQVAILGFCTTNLFLFASCFLIPRPRRPNRDTKTCY